MTAVMERAGDFAPFWADAMWRAAWQGGLAVAVVWVLSVAFPEVPARMRCWWWRLAFGKFFLCLFCATPIKLTLLPPAKPMTPIPPNVRRVQAWQPKPSPAHTQTFPFVVKVASVSVARDNASPSAMSVLSILWVLGVTVGLMGVARQWWLARRLISKSRTLQHDQIESDLALLAKQFGIRSLPQVRVADDLGVPLLSGLRHPVILMPPQFLNDKSPSQLRMMLAHELAHIKRRDLLWAWLALAARVLFFFHPMVLLARKESRLAEEMAADELSVTLGRLEPVDYAGMLVEVAARFFPPQKSEMVVGVIGSYQTLKRRLQAMKHIHSLPNRRTIAAGILFTFVGLGAIAPLQVTAQKSRAEQQERGGPQVLVQPKNDAIIRVDDEGHYNYGGRIMDLDDIIGDLKHAARAHSMPSVTVEVTTPLPVRALARLLGQLDESGINRVSMAIQLSQPEIFDIDFGVGVSKQIGPAAAGREGDFWNAVSVAWNNDHTESGLKFADGKPCPIQVRMVNLAGGWGNDGHMGVKDPMLDSFNYPMNNQGGNSQVVLKSVPPGVYDVYIYGHELNPLAYGDYTLTVGDRKYGRKATSNKIDAIENTSWVEDSQYVKYKKVRIGAGDEVNILIQPGGQSTDHWGRTFSDAVICGLQLIPVR